MTPVRFGIIGCSSIARRRALPAISASGMARLENIGSRDHSKAAGFAREFGCSKWGSYEAVLSDPNVDAVYISTPPALHESWVRASAEHGKHVLCEKPAFTNRRVAVELVELCRRQNVRLMEGYMFSYHPQHAVVQSLIGAGRIGKPRLVQGVFALPQPDEGNFRLQRELGGGVFLDAAGYPVAAAVLLVRTLPTSVCCHIRVDTKTGVDTAVLIWLDFPGGEIAQTVAAYGLHYRSNYSVLGTEGRIEVTRAFSVLPDKKTEIIVEGKSGTEIIPIEPADQFLLMIEDFCVEVAQANARKRPFEENLLRQHTVMEAAWNSHLQQRPVSLSETFNQ
jgi:dTDP-3,4-didehydro-2,6-dideoxy-alpha-D-glucose 3-reductase